MKVKGWWHLLERPLASRAGCFTTPAGSVSVSCFVVVLTPRSRRGAVASVWYVGPLVEWTPTPVWGVGDARSPRGGERAVVYVLLLIHVFQ